MSEDTQTVADALRASPGTEIATRVAPELDRFARLGKWLAASESGSNSMESLSAAAALRLFYAQELGLPPLAAAELSVIKGNLNVSAKLLRALARERGFRVVRRESSAESCTADIIEAGSGEILGSDTFTIEDARRAGLIRGGGAWTTHPKRMLWARVSKYLIDDYAPEVSLGMVIHDEAIEMTAQWDDEPRVDKDSADGPQAAVATEERLTPGAVSQPDKARDATSEAGPSAENFVTSKSPAEILEAAHRDADPEPEERTFPGPLDTDDPRLLAEDARGAIYAMLGTDEANLALARWTRHLMDANAAKNLVRDTDDVLKLQLWADSEVRTRDRKTVLEAIDKRLVKLGGTDVSASGEVEEEVAPSPSPAADPFYTAEMPGEGEVEVEMSPERAALDADDGDFTPPPIPEALQPIEALTRMRALMHFVAENQSSVSNPYMWCMDGIRDGAKASNWKGINALEDLDDRQLAAIWSVVPEELRTHIESLPAEVVVKMAAAVDMNWVPQSA